MRLRRDGSGTEKIDEEQVNRDSAMDSCVRKHTLILVLSRRYLHELRDRRRMIYQDCNNQAEIWLESLEDFRAKA